MSRWYRAAAMVLLTPILPPPDSVFVSDTRMLHAEPTRACQRFTFLMM